MTIPTSEAFEALAHEFEEAAKHGVGTWQSDVATACRIAAKVTGGHGDMVKGLEALLGEHKHLAEPIVNVITLYLTDQAKEGG